MAPIDKDDRPDRPKSNPGSGGQSRTAAPIPDHKKSPSSVVGAKSSGRAVIADGLPAPVFGIPAHPGFFQEPPGFLARLQRIPIAGGPSPVRHSTFLFKNQPGAFYGFGTKHDLEIGADSRLRRATIFGSKSAKEILFAADGTATVVPVSPDQKPYQLRPWSASAEAGSDHTAAPAGGNGASRPAAVAPARQPAGVIAGGSPVHGPARDSGSSVQDYGSRIHVPGPALGTGIVGSVPPGDIDDDPYLPAPDDATAPPEEQAPRPRRGGHRFGGRGELPDRKRVPELLSRVAGGIPRMSTGGRVVGRGTSTSDDNLSWLSNGEFVVNADAASRALPLLEALNSGWVPSSDFLQGILPGFMSPPQVSTDAGAGFDPMAFLLGSNQGSNLNSLLAPFRTHPVGTVDSPATPQAKTLELPGPTISENPSDVEESGGWEGLDTNDVISSGLSSAITGGVRGGLFGAIKGGITGVASEAGGQIGAAIGTALGAGLGPAAPIATAVGATLGSTVGQLAAETVLKPVEVVGKYAADTAKEVIGSGFGLVDLAKGPGGHTARQDIYNFNGMDPKSVAIAVERVRRRRTLAQQRGGGLGR
ncbi:hypothetical protein [Nocardia bhagyanarayanae]|uniref:Uncharacterized protein n=1 Tax=Nocardia bhagyanarayanae TaxID=1215925 RepID=A0A543F7Q1_9NOCA|nr:hypothetical protein [Nocardia bhagyanarayanae]TQM29862.1 hypothetical protein FB390_1475 [Nocardia bhagyanarayanae]